MNESGPKFSDVIAALVSSLASARSVADVEALRIAHRYHRDELLKGLPVPRLRLRKVSISLPVMLTGVIPGAAAEVQPSRIIEDAVVKAFETGVAAFSVSLKRAEQDRNSSEEERKRLERYRRLLDFVQTNDFSSRLRDDFRARLADALLELAAHGGKAAPDAAIQTAAGEAADHALQELFDEATYLYIEARVAQEQGDFDAERARQDKDTLNQDEIIQDLKERVRHAASDAALKSPTVPPDFSVSVHTDEIKNSGGGPDAVTRLSMVITEEGLEWVTEVNHSGEERTKLVPE